MQELEKILEEMDNCIKEVREKTKGYEDFEAFRLYESVMNLAKTIVIKYMNDGWIPVKERLPEEKKSVLVQWEKYDRHLNVTLTYLDVMWLENEEDVVFETINGIPNGRVIAWRPLPEPYRPERSDNHDGE